MSELYKRSVGEDGLAASANDAEEAWRSGLLKLVYGFNLLLTTAPCSALLTNPPVCVLSSAVSPSFSLCVVAAAATVACVSVNIMAAAAHANLLTGAWPTGRHHASSDNAARCGHWVVCMLLLERGSKQHSRGHSALACGLCQCRQTSDVDSVVLRLIPCLPPAAPVTPCLAAPVLSPTPVPLLLLSRS